MAVVKVLEEEQQNAFTEDILARLDELRSTLRRASYNAYTLAKEYAQGQKVSSKLTASYYDGQEVAYRRAAEMVEHLMREILNGSEVT